MIAFVKISAVLVALGNVILWGYIDEENQGIADVALSGLVPFLLTLGVVIGPGLATAVFLLKAMREMLEGRFSDRYSAMAAGVFLNGMLVGATYGSISVLYGNYSSSAEGLVWAVGVPSAALYGSVMGGLFVGIPESLILAFPLAAILGRFRTVG